MLPGRGSKETDQWGCEFACESSWVAYSSRSSGQTIELAWVRLWVSALCYLTPVFYNKLPSRFKAKANLKVFKEFFNADAGLEDLDLDHYLLNYNTFVAFSLLCGV